MQDCNMKMANKNDFFHSRRHASILKYRQENEFS